MNEEPTNITAITSIKSSDDIVQMNSFAIHFQPNYKVIDYLNKQYPLYSFHAMGSVDGVDVNSDPIGSTYYKCEYNIVDDNVEPINDIVIPVIEELLSHTKEKNIYLYNITAYTNQNKLQFKIRGHF